MSFGGDWFLLVPMLGLVNELSGSPVLIAAVLAANTLPAFLASPLGGVLADRLDRRRIIVWSNLGAALAAIAMLAVDAPGVIAAGASVPLILGGLAILAILSALISPASSAAVPAIVAPQDLANATFLIESTWGMMAAVGAAAGGLVSSLIGRETAIVIDSLSFVAAAWLVWRIRAPLRLTAAIAHGADTSLRAAIHYVMAARPVRALLTSKAGFAVFGAGAVALLPVLAIDAFGAGDDGIGLLLGARGVGVLFGPFWIRRMLGGIDRKVLGAIGFTMALWGASYLGTAAAPSLVLAALAVLIGHLGAGSQWSFSSYGLQRYAADEFKGRVFGLDFAAVTLTSTISQLLFGWLAEEIAVRTILTWLALAAVAFGLLWRQITKKYWA
ncbi:MAG: MFS transporter [Acidimicrobiia bacterium]